jgi:hypothetical protein
MRRALVPTYPPLGSASLCVVTGDELPRFAERATFWPRGIAIVGVIRSVRPVVTKF